MKNILLSSILFSIMFLLLAVFRKINYFKYRKQTFRLLWILLIIRLLIPNSIFGFKIPVNTIPATITNDASMHMANLIYRTQNYSKPFIHYFARIWWMGFILSISILTLHYIHFRIGLKKTLLLANNPKTEELEMTYQLPIQVRFTNINTSPFVTGIFKKILVLPQQLIDLDDRMDLDYIIQHEMIHIKKKDNLIKMLYLVARCIHWFNPFVYIMGRMLNMDIEMACDEAVAEKLSKNEKIDYCKVLYKHCTREAIHSPLYNTSFSSKGLKIKERFDSILVNNRKYGRGILVVCVLVVLTSVVITFESTQFSSEDSVTKLSYGKEEDDLKQSDNRINIVISGKTDDKYIVFDSTVVDYDYIDFKNILDNENIITNISQEDLERLSDVQIMIWRGNNE